MAAIRIILLRSVYEDSKGNILKAIKDSDGNISVEDRNGKTVNEWLHPVYMRIADRNNKRLHLSTGFIARPDDFDDGKNVGRYRQGSGVKSFQVIRIVNGQTEIMTNKVANIELSTIENKANEIIKGYEGKGVNWTLELFKKDYAKNPGRTIFAEYATERIKELRDSGKPQTAKVLIDALSSFRAFDPKFDKKYIQDLTTDYLGRYITHCEKRGHNPNTISIRLRQIRRVFNIAIDEGLIDRTSYPFTAKGVSIPESTNSKTECFLPSESLRKIANTQFENPTWERTKHLFLFSYYCRGINWKDMAKLRKSNITTATDNKTGEPCRVISYVRTKTKDTKKKQSELVIKITDPIQRELDWFRDNTALFQNYLLPIITADTTISEEDYKAIKNSNSSRKFRPETVKAIQTAELSLDALNDDILNEYTNKKRTRFNKELKEIAKAIELPEGQQDLTIYVARHSFAMMMYNEKGLSIDRVSEALGHESTKTTRAYLAKFSINEMAEDTFIDLQN